MYFSNYLTFMDEALIAYQRQLGYSWRHFEDMGIGMYYVDCGCQFKGAVLVEDTLQIHTAFSKLGHSSFKADMTLFRTDGAELVGHGFIAGVMVDVQTQKPIRIPDGFRDAVSAYQGAKSWH